MTTFTASAYVLWLAGRFQSPSGAEIARWWEVA
jgi:hypothetical protein